MVASDPITSLSKIPPGPIKPLALTKATNINSEVSPWLTPIAYPVMCGLVLPNYFKSIRVSGQEHLPTNGPVILAPTHRSRWDAILIAAFAGRRATGRDPRFMVSANEVKGIQGWFIRRLGGFPLDPAQPAIASLRYGVEILQQQEMLVIFPEGNIFRDSKIHPLKPGLARLALQAESLTPGLEVKIVPVTINYSQPVPNWGTAVDVRFGAALHVNNYRKTSAKQNAQLLTEDLTIALKQLNGEF